MSQQHVPPTGELRQSQVLTTFGPGAMVDLPNHSVLIGGLEGWIGERERVFESRLGRLATRATERSRTEAFCLHPVDSDDSPGGRTGIAVHQFPTWFLGQVNQTFQAPDGRVYRTRPLVPWERLVKGGYLDENRKVQKVVPVRFVQACTRGHISDINWYAFVRQDFNAERIGELWFDEGGAGQRLHGDLRARRANGRASPAFGRNSARYRNFGQLWRTKAVARTADSGAVWQGQ